MFLGIVSEEQHEDHTGAGADTLVLMHTDAPLVADDIVAYVRDSISVSLVGPRGSGRTWVATRVADRLREVGFVVTLVRGVAALRDRPLAVLALAGVDIAGGAGLAIPRAVESLSALLPAGRSALIVDDADDLDSASAGVVAAVHAAKGAPVVSVTRPTVRQSGNRALIDGLHPGVRLRLEPMGFDQVHQLVHELLPGPVDPAAVSQIATLSGGLPGLVRAIVDAGERAGTIVRQGTVWRAKGILWDARLAHVVEPLLGDLDEDESAALRVLARAGTVTGTQVADIVPEAVLTRLEALGLLDVAETPAGTLVGLFPPLIAVYLRRTAVAGSPRMAPPEAPRPVGETTVRGASQAWLTSSLVAILNTRIVDHWRVQVAALRSAWQAEPTPRNAVPLLSALNEAAAGADEFEAVLAGTRPGPGDTPADVGLLRWEAQYRGVLLHDLDAARELLRRHREMTPPVAAQLRAAEAVVCLAAGVLPDDALLAPEGAREDPAAAATLDQARRIALVYAGRTVDALEGLQVGPDLSSHPEGIRATVVLAQVFDGDLDVGIESARREMMAAADRMDAGRLLQYAYIAGFGLMFAGRVGEAQALLDPALALTGPTMMYEYYHTGVLGLAALAACWRGQRDYCEALRAQAEAIGRRSGPFPEIVRVSDEALVRDADAAAIGEQAWSVVAERFAGGHVAAGISLAVEAAEVCPSADAVQRAVRQARDTQSPFLAALGGYMEAVAAGDPDRLAACADDFRARGATLYAVKAGIARALVLRARGDLAASIRQAEAAWALAGEPGPVPVGLFFPLGRALGLSTREREIAGLLADGMASQTIADTLGLGLHTVENYLSSAYRKLGSTGRADLIRAVTTWASQ